MKKILLYIALVFLLILLLLPAGLKTFGRNLYVDESDNEKENTNTMLKCIKGNETITTTYLNGSPYTFMYQIVGESISTSNENEENIEISDAIKDYAKYTSNDLSETAEYKIDFYKYDQKIPPELTDYSMTIRNQSDYYSNLGFVCLSSNF